MSSTEPVDIDALRASVTRQGALVRELKQNGGAAEDVKAAVDALKALKLQLDAEVAKQGPELDGLSKNDKKALDDLLIRKMFVVPSFEIYGGIGGFYDFGPPACALKANLLRAWRRHFVFEDKLLEVECTNLMPEIVLKTSGHVDRFTDLMVKCTKSGECYRADKLLEDHVENFLDKNPNLSAEEQEKHRMHATMAESYSPAEIHAVFQEYGIKAPGSGADLSFPVPFNLMFQCQIGPEGNLVGYLRPETAQGIFLNFRRLLEYNAGKVPFGCAQIGSAFRNEISPRAGLLRVREFQQAEIEYFVNPKDKSHAKFSKVANLVLSLLTKTNQLTDGKTVPMTCGEAVANGIIANEALAYYLARTYLFAEKIGIDLKRLRFRQHLDTEMSHYATDCWDLEIKLSSGWVECAGHADRSCYDLTVHAKKSKVEMVGTHKFEKPEKRQIVDIKANKGKMGREFKADLASINEALEALKDDVDRAIAFENELATNGEATIGPLCDGKQFTLKRDMVAIKVVEKMVSEEKFIPSVIEPSFGIGRILTAVFEHNFYAREGDEKRGVMSFNPTIAPIKVSVLPLSSNSAFEPFAAELEGVFAEEELECKVDSSSVAIGRKYARADELGIPFAVTIDFDTVESRVVTLRERDSCAQVRIPISAIGAEVRNLVKGTTTWQDVLSRFPPVAATEELYDWLKRRSIWNVPASAHIPQNPQTTKIAMGRSQVKYRTTHGRGRGRGGGGRGGGGGEETTEGNEAPTPRRSRGGGGRRPLESNAFRYEKQHYDDNENEGHEDAQHAVAGQTHYFRRQFFAGEENVREIGAAPSGAYFQSQTMKQWDAEDDDDPSAKSAIGVLDFNWIGEQLALVAPSIRYQMDPKYCVDFDFEAPAAAVAASDSEQEDDAQQSSQEDQQDKAVAIPATEPASSFPPPAQRTTTTPQTVATAAKAKPASAADSELDLLLQLSSTTPASSAQTANSSTTAAPAAVHQQKAAASPSDQLEDWLDDVLDM